MQAVNGRSRNNVLGGGVVAGIVGAEPAGWIPKTDTQRDGQERHSRDPQLGCRWLQSSGARCHLFGAPMVCRVDGRRLHVADSVTGDSAAEVPASRRLNILCVFPPLSPAGVRRQTAEPRSGIACMVRRQQRTGVLRTGTTCAQKKAHEPRSVGFSGVPSLDFATIPRREVQAVTTRGGIRLALPWLAARRPAPPSRRR